MAQKFRIVTTGPLELTPERTFTLYPLCNQWGRTVEFGKKQARMLANILRLHGVEAVVQLNTPGEPEDAEWVKVTSIKFVGYK